MAKRGTRRLKSLAILGALVAGLAATLGHSSDDAYETQLRKRADRIFEHERQMKDLPSNRIYALSIALKFQDAKGIEALVSSLEKRIQENQQRFNSI